VVATALVAALPWLEFAYRSSTAHVAVETSATLITVLAASILLGRLRLSHSLFELAVLIGLVALAIANLARAAAPSFDGGNPEVVWWPLGAFAVAGAALALAAAVPDRAAGDRRRVAGLLLLGTAVAAALTLLAGVLTGSLAPGLNPDVPPLDSGSIRIAGNAPLLISSAMVIALLGAASLGFLRRARQDADEFLGYLAAALALLCLARVHYLLFPSVYSEWIYTGDVLRLLAYLTLFAGALRQVAAYQRAAARAAIAGERRRIARDLHDSFAQDLAFISMQGDRLARREPSGVQIADAARAALGQSRAIIGDLHRAGGSLCTDLDSLARSLGGRHGVEIDFRAGPDAEAPPEVRSEILHIVGEAISNAVRHGEAARIRIRLTGGADRLGLTIEDDGHGFDATSSIPGDGGGIGLSSMRERAERLGGRLEVLATPGKGTTLRVEMP
jgi:signal transduction histidine kinase